MTTIDDIRILPDIPLSKSSDSYVQLARTLNHPDSSLLPHRARNPITGSMKFGDGSTLSARRSYQPVHQRSVFGTVTYTRAFYDIHPDWMSESQSARRLTARGRTVQTSREGRSSAKPLINLLLPLLDRERRQGDVTDLRRSAQAVHDDVLTSQMTPRLTSRVPTAEMREQRLGMLPQLQPPPRFNCNDHEPRVQHSKPPVKMTMYTPKSLTTPVKY